MWKNLWLVVSLLIFSCSAATAQILEPVKWSFSSKMIKAGEYDLIFTANMEPKWSIYSQYTEDSGPIPTSFTFEQGSHYSRVGPVKESGKKKEGPDPLFGDVVVIKFYEGPVVFTQRVKVTDLNKPIAGFLEFMTCDDERCLPPTEVEFSFSLQASGKAAVEPAAAARDAALVAGAAADQAAFSATEQKAALAGRGPLDPVQWSVSARPTADGKAQELVFTAVMEAGWTIYSQHTSPDGPIPTVFTFSGSGYRRQGEVAEGGKVKRGPDPLFGGVEVIKFVESTVSFTQRVLLEKPDAVVTGELSYMTCDDEQCLTANPLTFSFDFGKRIAYIGEGDPAAEAALPVAGSEPGGDQLYGLSKAKASTPVGACSTDETAVVESGGTGYWRIFVLGFLGGLLALLTPCVFPMIPLTVSFFTKSSGTKAKGLQNASLYGFFIFAVYLLLSVPFHLLDSLNPDILNDISTNVWLNLGFFIIFLFFAFSFFGYYELTLPSSWTNKASSAEGIGGVIGIFFMALTLALVSFSCTGPILGSLLAGALSADGGAMQLSVGMGGFGLALALPFALFAAFPGMLNNLPKSGGWLNSVKVVLGFLELALALKFLSNADMVKHWGVLKIELFLGLWIVIGLGLALYLFGLLKFPHDSPLKKLSLPRMGLAVLTTAFVVYLLSGFRTNDRTQTYEPLGLLSGLAPPVCYSFFKPCDCPQDLVCFKDLEEGMAYARENNKPVMLDFTGYACVNCRKMEEHVWPKEEVISLLRDEYVLISLYVDDKQELPAAEQVEVLQSHNGRMRKLRRTGDKWSHFQTEFFNINSQPYYVLLSPDGTLLNQPVGYTPDEKAYVSFLECGLNNFKALGKQQQPAGGK
jgi:thiol:disulfide interchange protein